MKTQLIPRRKFLHQSASALAVPLIAPGLAIAASDGQARKLQHASIGVGGMGRVDLSNFISHPDTEVVALCDVDAQHLEEARKLAPNARIYQDWRELIDKEGPKIDSINIAVPDHMHATIALTAMRAGKHAYCQKPMCHDVAEVRALTEAANQGSLVTQLGTQHAS